MSSSRPLWPSWLSRPFRFSRRGVSSATPPPQPPSSKEPKVSPTASEETSKPLPLGLEILAEGSDPVVDIVAVHGLNGHRGKTWTANNGVHWLRDLLPHDIPRARIFCWGYDANIHAGSRVSGQYLYDYARDFISELCRKRKLSDSTERPIIFIAHSLGGILIKSALIHSDAAREGALPEHRSIKVSTYGIIFLGTPHQGGNGVQLGKLLINIASIFVAADDRLLRILERDSEWLQQQLGQYGPISRDFVTKFAFEEHKTPIAIGRSIMVVPRASAVVPGQPEADSFPIHADHRSMVKYTSRQDAGYKTISEHLKIMADAAPEVIQQHWRAEERVNEARSNTVSSPFKVSFSPVGITEAEHFVAREEELAQIHQAVSKGTGRRTAVIHGLGGMGKTQLALAYVKRHQDDYSAVFWLNARDEATLKQGFVRAAERIVREHPSVVYVKNAVESHDLKEAVAAVKRWLDDPENGSWVVVYDNYDNPLLDDDGTPGQEKEAEEDAGTASIGYDIQPFFPDPYHGTVIITTRSPRVKGHRISLGKLKHTKDSLEILSNASNRPGLSNDPDAIELVRKLDGLPLALSTAGAYLHNMTTTFAEYLHLYKESWLGLQKTTPGVVSYEDRALHSTWNISYTQIERQNTNAAMLLRLWAYFDSDDLWFELLQEGHSRGLPWFRELTVDILGFNMAVRVLCDYGLIEANTSRRVGKESNGYGMHSCVHAWTVHVLNELPDVSMLRLAMRCVASHIPEATEREYWVVQRRLVQHASRYLERRFAEVPLDEADQWFPESLGNLFWNQDRLQDAEIMFHRALQGCQMTSETDSTTLSLNTLNSLGSLYRDMDQLQKAEAMYQQALKGREKSFGPHDLSTLDTVTNLGRLYALQDRLQEAETMYRRALQGYEDAKKPDDPSAFTTLNSLGSLYFDQGQLKEAEVMYQRALEGRKKAFGLDHTLTLNTMNNLGTLYKAQGRLQGVEAMYQQALQGYEKAFGPDHVLTLKTVLNLANLYAQQDRLRESEVMYKTALEGSRRAFGSANTLTLDILNCMGDFYLKHGRLQEAETVLKAALEGYEKVYTPDHTATLIVVHNIGEVNRDQGRLSEAESMLMRALKGFEKVLGSDHITTLETVNTLGNLYYKQNRLPEAEIKYEQALRGFEKALGPEKTDTYPPALTAMENFAELLAQQGRVSEAVALYSRCQGGLKAAFGAEHDRCKRVTRELAALGQI